MIDVSPMSLSKTDIAQVFAELASRLPPSARRIFAVAQVRNEYDIIERFVRHALSWADALVIIEHMSSDGTGDLLRLLCDEGLALGILCDDAIGKHQAASLTHLVRAAARIGNAHVVVPLDADEFLVDENGDNPRLALQNLPRGAVSFATWKTYVPTADDPSGELDVLKRITHRRYPEVHPIPKVIVGVDVAGQDSFRLPHGVHSVFVGGTQVTHSSLVTLFHVAHFPVRSAGQITAKVALNRLSIPFSDERQPDSGVHYEWLQALVPISSYMSVDDLQRAAQFYALDKPPLSTELVADPVKDSSGPLRYTQSCLVDASALVAAAAWQIAKSLRGGGGHYREETDLAGLISAENETLRGALSQCRDENAVYAAQISRLLSSRSWRMTAQLRYLAARMLRVARNLFG
jgi:hypothetical protein